MAKKKVAPLNKPFGRTARQELVAAAQLKMRIWRRDGQTVTPGDAIESVTDGVLPNTLGGMMKSYVEGLNATGWRRIECEIEREAAK